MKFQFNINLTDEDYIYYNIFHMTRSHYGKKIITSMRIVFSVFLGFFLFVTLVGGGFSLQAVVDSIPTILLLVLFQLLFLPSCKLMFKWYVKVLGKKGKMGYSPFAVMEFFEDVFVETTPQKVIEQKHSALERVGVVDHKYVYIHINNVTAYIVPFACFESEEQRNEFIEFIKTKCTDIDYYN